MHPDGLVFSTVVKIPGCVSRQSLRRGRAVSLYQDHFLYIGERLSRVIKTCRFQFVEINTRADT